MDSRKFYVMCESMGKCKGYFVRAYCQYGAEKEALHEFKAEFPMLAFYARVKNISLAE